MLSFFELLDSKAWHETIRIYLPGDGDSRPFSATTTRASLSPNKIEGRGVVAKRSTKAIGDELEALVAAYYEALGYKVIANIKLDGHQVDLLATIQVPGAGPFALMIEAKGRTTDTLGINEITPFKNTAGDLLRTGRIQSAILVTNGKFSQDARSAILAEPGMRLSTIHDLEQDLFNYSEALLRLVDEYEVRPIFRTYIPLGARADEKTSIPDVVDFITTWSIRGEKLLILCGDFGTGKTTVLDRVQYQQAKLRLQNHSVPLPLSFQLRDLLKYPDLWSFVSACLNEINHVSPTKALFEKQLAAGKFLILLDGFDEIATGANALERAAHLKTLAPLITASSPCVISTRPTYFESLNKMVETFINSLTKPHTFSRLDRLERQIPALLQKLNIAQGPPTIHPDALKNIVTLSRWSDRAIDRYLDGFATLLSQRTKLTPEQVRQFLFRIYDFEDLMSRPLLLEMVVHTILEGALDITATTSLGPATLYDLYTQFCAQRDVVSRSEQFLTSEERLAVCRELAAFMLSERKQVLSPREVIQVIERTLPQSLSFYPVDQRDEATERAFTDVRVCSFLSFQDDGSLRFSHKSYSEYFVAQKLVIDLTRLREEGTRWELLTDFATQPVGREIIYFLGSFARDKLDFGRLVVDTINEHSDPRIPATNLLRRVAFASGSLLEGLTLSHGDITSVDLRKADVDSATLTDIQLSHATVRDLRATSWKLSQCTLSDTEVINTSFCNTDLRVRVQMDSILQSCSFSGGSIDIRGSNWVLRGTMLDQTKASFGGDGQLDNVTISQSRVTISANLHLLPESSIIFRQCTLLGEERKLSYHSTKPTALAAHIWYKKDTKIEFDDVLFLGVILDPITLASLPTRAPAMILKDCKGIIFFSDPHSRVSPELVSNLRELFPRILFSNLFDLNREISVWRPNTRRMISSSVRRLFPWVYSDNSATREIASWLKEIDDLPSELEPPLSDIMRFDASESIRED